MTKTVVAVDPGGTTGVAVWSRDAVLVYAQCDDWQQAVDYVLATHPDVIVCESFHITTQTAKKSRSYDALYMIGALLYECNKRGVPLTLQAPSERQFATPKKLAAIGWQPRGDHATQAARHLLTYLFKTGEITAMELHLGDC